MITSLLVFRPSLNSISSTLLIFRLLHNGIIVLPVNQLIVLVLLSFNHHSLILLTDKEHNDPVYPSQKTNLVIVCQFHQFLFHVFFCLFVLFVCLFFLSLLTVPYYALPFIIFTYAQLFQAVLWEFMTEIPVIFAHLPAVVS